MGVIVSLDCGISTLPKTLGISLMTTGWIAWVRVSLSIHKINSGSSLHSPLETFGLIICWQLALTAAAAAAATAKLLQSCLTLCDPIDGSPPGSPSLGFSRQEHWSGLPFPSPMHESEKWKWSRSVVSDSSQPHGLQPTRLLHPWDFPGKSTGVGCHHLHHSKDTKI